jgi:hypothetical protein
MLKTRRLKGVNPSKRMRCAGGEGLTLDIDEVLGRCMVAQESHERVSLF